MGHGQELPRLDLEEQRLKHHPQQGVLHQALSAGLGIAIQYKNNSAPGQVFLVESTIGATTPARTS